MRIKNFKDFSKTKLNENTELINTILDKINDTGMDSLTDYEKSVLNNASRGDNKFETMEDDVISFLDKRFGKLLVRKYKRTSFGFPIVGYYFINEEENSRLLDLELYKILDEKTNRVRILNALCVDYRSLKDIKDRYGLYDKDMHYYIKKWFMNSSYIGELSYNKELPLPDNFDIKDVRLVF